MNKKAIIIGAGIAGPAMALQLKRIGIQATVFEARVESEMGQGVFLGITPNGLNALKEVIDISRLKEEYTPGRMVFYNGKNKPIGLLDTKGQLEKYGAETIQVKRSRISAELRNEVERQGITIRYGCRLTNIQENNEGVVARFQDGKEYKADLLIACDGTHSTCRRILFPEAPQPIYTKQLSTGAMVRLQGLDSEFGDIKMVFGKQAFFSYAVSNQGEVWWFNNFYREKEPSREEISTTLQKEIKTHLLSLHKDDPEPIVELIKKTDEVFAYPVYELAALQKWYTNRVCLIGDAAHATAPHIGQGASLALEDTVALANCLKNHDTYAKSFAAFQTRRQPRVERLIQTARKVGNTKSKPNPIATFFRDLLLKYFLKLEIRKMDWVYRYKPE